MQFYLNGYTVGDPEMLPPAASATKASEGLPDEVDVLIVGCGPAGLVLAAQLAAFPGIKTRIVDRRPGPLELGQADGIACRTVEMFTAFGFGERLLKEAYWVNETVFWKPDPNDRSKIVRSGRIQDVEDGLSECPHVIVNQARVHDYLLEVMRKSSTRLVPDYNRHVKNVEVGDSGDYPVTVTLQRMEPDHQGQEETIRARYVVGCDGARSSVRQSIGRALVGDVANQAWGVMDVLAVTDFPDIRLKSVIHSANEGNVLIIPREGGYLVRFYIELDKLNPDQHLTTKDVTTEQLIAATNRIIHPYTVDVKDIAWWSVYEIGQRLCDKFDDVPKEEMKSRFPRVFIAGDACHTHSAKAGQGMNVSMQDTFNLGWKLAAVLRGTSSPALLHTYSAERQAIAKELIDFDREFARMFSAPPKESGSAEGEGVDPKEFQRYFVAQGRFTAGTATRYDAFADLRRAHVPASRRRLRAWHALPFGAGHPPRGRQAHAARTCGRCGRCVANLRIRRFAESAGSRVTPRCAVQVPRFRRISDQAIYAARRRYRFRDRRPGHLPARASRPFRHRNAASPAAAEGPLRPDRLREDVLP